MDRLTGLDEIERAAVEDAMQSVVTRDRQALQSLGVALDDQTRQLVVSTAESNDLFSDLLSEEARSRTTPSRTTPSRTITR